jgi:hypothetical protein
MIVSNVSIIPCITFRRKSSLITKKPLTKERLIFPSVYHCGLIVPLRAGFGTLRLRLPGGHRASSLTPS